MARGLHENLWDDHVVSTYDDGSALLYIDRHLVQEVSSPQAFASLEKSGRRVRCPSATLAVADHAVPTRNRGGPIADLSGCETSLASSTMRSHNQTTRPPAFDIAAASSGAETPAIGA